MVNTYQNSQDRLHCIILDAVDGRQANAHYPKNKGWNMNLHNLINSYWLELRTRQDSNSNFFTIIIRASLDHQFTCIQ